MTYDRLKGVRVDVAQNGHSGLPIPQTGRQN